MKQNTTTRIIAGFAFFWIIISIIWSGLLILFAEDTPTNTYTPEQLESIQNEIQSRIASGQLSSWSLDTSSGANSEIIDIIDYNSGTIEATQE